MCLLPLKDARTANRMKNTIASLRLLGRRDDWPRSLSTAIRENTHSTQFAPPLFSYEVAGAGRLGVVVIVTFPFSIQHSVQPRHLMIHFMATCRIHFIVICRLRADGVCSVVINGDCKLRWNSGSTKTTRSRSFLSTSSLCVSHASEIWPNFSVSLSTTDCASSAYYRVHWHR